MQTTYRTRSPMTVVGRAVGLTPAAAISQPRCSRTGRYASSLRGVAVVRSACQTKTYMRSSRAVTP